MLEITKRHSEITDADMDKNLERLSYMPIGKLLWEYSLPAVIGVLVVSLYNIIDRIYIGQGVGPEAIAGLGITFPVTNLSSAFGVLIGAGASARTSIFLGATLQEKAERVLGNSLVFTIVIGSVYTSLFGIYIDPILYAFGASEQTIPYARDFMLWSLPGFFLTNLCFNLNNIMRASGYPNRAMATMIIGAVCNIALDPIFIFVLDMGIKGAAIATDISMGVSTLFVLQHFCRSKSTVHFKRGIYGIRWKILFGIISIGAAPSVVNLAACLVNITINNALKDFGSPLYIGAASIFVTYTSFLVTFVLGVALGMQPIIGYNYGAGNIHRLKKTFSLSVIVSTIICAAGCVIGVLFPSAIARIFTSDTSLIEVTAKGLRIALMMFWVVGFQIIATNFFQSIGKAGKSIFMGLLRQVIFLYPFLIILPAYFGLKGVWASFPLSDAFATVITIILIIWQFRQINSMKNESLIRNRS